MSKATRTVATETVSAPVVPAVKPISSDWTDLGITEEWLTGLDRIGDSDLFSNDRLLAGKLVRSIRNYLVTKGKDRFTAKMIADWVKEPPTGSDDPSPNASDRIEGATAENVRAFLVSEKGRKMFPLSAEPKTDENGNPVQVKGAGLGWYKLNPVEVRAFFRG